jgi:hypothetical protein
MDYSKLLPGRSIASPFFDRARVASLLAGQEPDARCFSLLDCVPTIQFPTAEASSFQRTLRRSFFECRTHFAPNTMISLDAPIPLWDVNLLGGSAPILRNSAKLTEEWRSWRIMKGERFPSRSRGCPNDGLPMRGDSEVSTNRSPFPA